MSICSDVYITKEDAVDQVTKILMYEQEKLVRKAVQAMSDDELSCHLNKESDLYYYNIENTKVFEFGDATPEDVIEWAMEHFGEERMMKVLKNET
jgi:iron-sulfur cluster repair protein YtfE (RIC family)